MKIVFNFFLLPRAHVNKPNLTLSTLFQRISWAALLAATMFSLSQIKMTIEKLFENNENNTASVIHL